jgi:hypothetical protein
MTLQEAGIAKRASTILRIARYLATQDGRSYDLMDTPQKLRQQRAYYNRALTVVTMIEAVIIEPQWDMPAVKRDLWVGSL